MTVTIGSAKFPDRHALGTITVHATGAETAYVDVTPLFRIGQINFGIQIQTHGAAVTPSFTMAAAETARVPANDAKVPWKSQSQIAANDMVVFGLAATVVKLVFAGAGVAYIGTF